MTEIVVKMHYHDNDGLSDELEVVEAPGIALMSLEALRSSSPTKMSIWFGNTLVFGTDGLGLGRVAYVVDGWSVRESALTMCRFDGPLPCCDMHNDHCEPPSELCCGQCTEIAHPDHADGSDCVLPD